MKADNHTSNSDGVIDVRYPVKDQDLLTRIEFLEQALLSLQTRLDAIAPQPPAPPTLKTTSTGQ